MSHPTSVSCLTLWAKSVIQAATEQELGTWGGKEVKEEGEEGKEGREGRIGRGARMRTRNRASRKARLRVMK